MKNKQSSDILPFFIAPKVKTYGGFGRAAVRGAEGGGRGRHRSATASDNGSTRAQLPPVARRLRTRSLRV